MCAKDLVKERSAGNWNNFLQSVHRSSGGQGISREGDGRSPARRTT